MQTINGIGTTIYGSAKSQALSGQERVQTEEAGFYPYSYQVIMWFVICFLPVIPLGTYRVMKVKPKSGFWTLEHPWFEGSYAMVKVDWDWGQVLRHYIITYGILALIVLMIAFSK